MTVRPRRKAIPATIKVAVLWRQAFMCKCGCGDFVGPGFPTHYDHEPALRLRAVNRAGTDYIPAQHDPAYIDARCPDSHRVKTHGAGATTAGTDIGKIKKLRRHEPGAKTKPKRRIQSRGFSKGHRPMQSRKKPGSEPG